MNLKGYLLKAQFLFVAGCVAGVVAHTFLWSLNELGVTQYWNIHWSPPVDFTSVSEHVVSSGLWAFIFFLPIFHDKRLLRAIIFSLAPTLFKLFVMFPNQADAGWAGFGLGQLTPLLVWIVYLVWSLVTVWWLRMWTTSG